MTSAVVTDWGSPADTRPGGELGADSPTRALAVADTHMSRVTTAWSISSRTVQALFIVAGGALAAAISPRFALATAIVLLTSGLLLPWRLNPDDTRGADPRTLATS